MSVRDPLAIAESQSFKLAIVQQALDDFFRRLREPSAHPFFIRLVPRRIASQFRQRAPMTIGNLKESLEIFFWIRATLHSKKIDDLDEELRLTVAGFANGLDK